MNTLQKDYYIGLMTGTSMDAVDTVLIEVPSDGRTKLVTSYDYPLPDGLRQTIITACNSDKSSAQDFASLDIELAETYAICVQALLEKSEVSAEHIRAIGSHGQTIRHCPDCSPPYTIQLGNGERLLALTGITTVNDFRQADMDAGGQGAPLAPGFHHHLFAQPGKTRVGINLGGIANISILHANGQISGFDTGPANTLMDKWIERHQGKRYDRDATWAQTGQINTHLLEALLSEDWLSRKPPKSTGPELFNLEWLDQHLAKLEISPADVQRSLCEYSAITLTNAISQYAPGCDKAIICGGGAYNPLLLDRIKHHLPDTTLLSSEHYGIAPEWVEACMFAWLAHRTINNLPGNVPAVTGASHEVVLGKIYPA